MNFENCQRRWVYKREQESREDSRKVGNRPMERFAHYQKWKNRMNTGSQSKSHQIQMLNQNRSKTYKQNKTKNSMTLSLLVHRARQLLISILRIHSLQLYSQENLLDSAAGSGIIMKRVLRIQKEHSSQLLKNVTQTCLFSSQSCFFGPVCLLLTQAAPGAPL